MVTAQKKASMLRNPWAMNSNNKVQKSQINSTKPSSVRRDTNAKTIIGTPNFEHYNQARKTLQMKPKLLTLTKTSQRAHSVKIKSSAELEEGMKVKIPKFMARPSNKNILETPALPSLPRSTMQPPKYKEFHLETMSRANHNAKTSTIASMESTQTQNYQWKPDHLMASKLPILQRSLRAHLPGIKSSVERFERIPQFKARPLNRKILECKREGGISFNMKKQVSIPREFHFTIDKRIPPPATAVLDLFNELSTSSKPHREKPFQRNTTPNPFHLHTVVRGAEKEKRMFEKLMQKQLEEEKARIPKAKSCPYTTYYPMFPPKPEPKPCTKPKPFQLGSLSRHEEAQMRIFKAQPVLKEDPIPLSGMERKPLTEVQEFNLYVDSRAADRAEFDKKIKEKEMMYNRYIDDAESAKMEEEKALKQLRRTLVPHARPVPMSDKGVTKAKSPKLHINHRKEKRRIVFPAAASCAVASHMR